MSAQVPVPGSNRPRQRSAGRVRDVDPEQSISLTIALADASAQTVAAVSEVLAEQGLEIGRTAGRGHSLRVRGTAARIEQIFSPGLGIYENDEQGEFIGREGQISIPSQLEGRVVGVFGLDQRRVARRRAGNSGDGYASGATSTQAAAPALSPAAIRSHYNFPAGTGSGQTVAVAEFGGGYFSSDLEAFCQKQGTAVPTVTAIGVNGAKVLTLQEIQQLPSQQQQQQLDDSVEVNLDVQIIAGLAPDATILVYFSNFTEQGWVDLIDEVVDGTPDKALALSVSWGLAEDDPDWSAGAVQAIDQRLAAAAELGITVCAAAGDDGSADQESDGKAHVDFPSSSPHTLAVGGTMLNAETDVVWWQSPGERTSSGGGATGGGVSTIFAKPSWQANVEVASINAGAIAGRIVPDIAALAGPPYYDVIFMGKDSPNGGTSAATPTWAALLVLLAAASPTPWKPAFLSPLLYAATAGGDSVGAAGCTDVTSGDNTSSTLGKGYSAGPGFDAVSGWGVPNGVALLTALTAAGG
jgi:kumamolisin